MFQLVLRAVSLSVVCSICGISQATVISFQANFEFSGGTAPSGSAPWLTAIFNDNNTPGSVKLTLSATNLVGSEFISGWYLNLNPAMDAGSLVFSSPTIVGSLDAPTISKGTNSFKADGDGYYDIMLTFSTSGSGGGSRRFGVGESISYTITGIPILTSDSFNYGSVNGGGTGTYLMAAHVQGIGSGGSFSGWVAPSTTGVPEPATMSLLALGGLTMFIRRRRM